MKRIALLLAVTPLVACTGVSATHVYKRPPESALFVSGAGKDEYVPTPGNQGIDFCRNVENTARLSSIKSTKWGWFFGILSGASIGAGVVMTAGAYNDSDIYRVSNASMPILGALFGVAANALFTRSKDAGELAATAARSVNLKDEEANTQCNIAIASWNSSRSSANGALVDYLNAKDKHNKIQTNDAPPGGVAPGGAAPGGASPGGVAPGGASPGGASPGGASPGGASPGGAAPGGASPGGASPGGASPGGASPGGAAQSRT